MQFLASAGFDSLVSVRIIAYGIALFLPITILGVGVCKSLLYDVIIVQYVHSTLT